MHFGHCLLEIFWPTPPPRKQKAHWQMGFRGDGASSKQAVLGLDLPCYTSDVQQRHQALKMPLTPARVGGSV
jgi:hypothetical protein